MMDKETCKAGATHRHYKGGYYKKLHDATCEATGEYLIVYQSLEDGRVWVRSAANFHQTVGDVPRFERLQ